MTVRTMLFSFEGRISRGQWWVATILLGLAYLCLTFALASFLSADAFSADSPMPTAHKPPLLIGLPVFLAFQWPNVAVGVKRFHDAGMRGWPVFVFSGLNILGFLLTYETLTSWLDALRPFDGMPREMSFGLVMVFVLLLAIYSLWMFFRLASTDGATGPNRYGPSPKDEPAEAAART